MNFRKKLKLRLYLAIGYIVLGVLMIAVFNIMKLENNFLSSYGLALIVIGIVRIRKYFIITKNDESIRKQQIAETDERNIAIANKAKSISFYIYVLLTCVSVIVLEILNMGEIATFLSLSLCVLLLIYWISCFIIRKKS